MVITILEIQTSTIYTSRCCRYWAWSTWSLTGRVYGLRTPLVPLLDTVCERDRQTDRQI